MALHTINIPPTPSGTGYVHVTSGVQDSTAGTAVDSTAQSNATSAGLAASVAQSVAASTALIAGVDSTARNAASVADSKAVSDSLNISTAQSGVTTGATNTSTAQSTATSAGLGASNATSAATSDSLLCSAALSMGTAAMGAVSAKGTISGTQAITAGGLTLITATLNQATTFTVSGGVAGQRITFQLAYSGSAYAATFSTNFKSTGTVTTVSGKLVTITFCYDATSWNEISRQTTGV